MSLVNTMNQAICDLEMTQDNIKKVKYYEKRFIAFEAIIDEIKDKVENSYKTFGVCNANDLLITKITKLKSWGLYKINYFELVLERIDKILVKTTSAILIDILYGADKGLNVSVFMHLVGKKGIPIMSYSIAKGERAVQNATIQAIELFDPYCTSFATVVAWFDIDKTTPLMDLLEAKNIIEQRLLKNSRAIIKAVLNTKKKRKATATVVAMLPYV